MLILLVDVFQKGERSQPSSPVIPWLTLVGIALATVANGLLPVLAEVGPAAMIGVDAFRVFANYLFLLAAALFILISTRYFDQEHLRLGELYVLVLFATVGMMVFAGARDLMVMFLGLEVMSLPVYVLTGINRRDRRSSEGALKYFLLGAFSSAFFLFGIALVYGGAGTTQLNLIAAAVGVDGLSASPLLPIGLPCSCAASATRSQRSRSTCGRRTPTRARPPRYHPWRWSGRGVCGVLRVFLTAFPGCTRRGCTIATGWRS
jgi:NADH-quinone oxidoreductase subunit N